MRWARRCQASYPVPVTGLVLFCLINFSLNETSNKDRYLVNGNLIELGHYKVMCTNIPADDPCHACSNVAHIWTRLPVGYFHKFDQKEPIIYLLY